MVSIEANHYWPDELAIRIFMCQNYLIKIQAHALLRGLYYLQYFDFFLIKPNIRDFSFYKNANKVFIEEIFY